MTINDQFLRHPGLDPGQGFFQTSSMKLPCVYILANRYRGSMYVGVTSDLVLRVSEHRLDLKAGYTVDRDIKLLVWYEPHAEMPSAILREKQIKRWLREWKFALIEKSNPRWRDLFSEIAGEV
jgi:putative endonuclease